MIVCNVASVKHFITCKIENFREFIEFVIFNLFIVYLRIISFLFFLLFVNVFFIILGFGI